MHNRALYQNVEQHFPFPLASTCRHVRARTRWQERVEVYLNLLEVTVRHVQVLALASYLAEPVSNRKVNRFLLGSAFKSAQTIGRMADNARQPLQHLHRIRSRALLPELQQCWFESPAPHTDQEVLTQLIRLRNGWVHPGESGYQEPQLDDYERFVLGIETLLERLLFLVDWPLVAVQGMRLVRQRYELDVAVLSGCSLPFAHETLVSDQPYELHSVLLYDTRQQQFHPLYPWYRYQPEQGLIALKNQVGDRLVWNHAFGREQETEAWAWLQRRLNPELPPDVPPQLLPGDVRKPVGEVPVLPPFAQPAVAPSFRRGSPRLFTADWGLTRFEIYNSPHENYDSLRWDAQVLAHWLWLPEPGLYLLGIRQGLLPAASAPLRQAVHLPMGPLPEQLALFTRHKGSQWHHAVYDWYTLSTQAELGALLRDIEQLMPS